MSLPRFTSRRATSRRTKLQQPTKVQFLCFRHSNFQNPASIPLPPQSPRTQSSMPHTFRPFRGKPTTLAEDQAQEMDSKSNQTNPSQSGEGATNMPTISNARPPHQPLSIAFPPRKQQTLAPLTGNSRLQPTIPTARKSMRMSMMTPSRRSSSYSSSPSSMNFPIITKEQRTRPEVKPRRSHDPRRRGMHASLGI